jgi:hypothetical protein
MLFNGEKEAYLTVLSDGRYLVELLLKEIM